MWSGGLAPPHCVCMRGHLRCMMEMEGRYCGAGDQIVRVTCRGWLTVSRKRERQECFLSGYLSICPLLHALLLSISWQDSYSRPGKDRETVTKICQSMFPWLIFSGMSQTPVWSNVYVRTDICVCFVSVVKKLHCVSLPAYANATGECGSWGGGGALLRLLAARKFCGKSDGAAEANFNFFKRTLRNSCFCWNAGCVFPDEKHTGAHVAISVSGWWEANTTLPWHLGWLVRLASPGREQIKMRRGGGDYCLVEVELSWILSLEGGCACVCAWMHERRLGKCVSGSAARELRVCLCFLIPISNTYWTTGCLQPLRLTHTRTHTPAAMCSVFNTLTYTHTCPLCEHAHVTERIITRWHHCIITHDIHCILHTVQHHGHTHTCTRPKLQCCCQTSASSLLHPGCTLKWIHALTSQDFDLDLPILL